MPKKTASVFATYHMLDFFKNYQHILLKNQFKDKINRSKCSKNRSDNF